MSCRCPRCTAAAAAAEQRRLAAEAASACESLCRDTTADLVRPLARDAFWPDFARPRPLEQPPSCGCR